MSLKVDGNEMPFGRWCAMVGVASVGAVFGLLGALYACLGWLSGVDRRVLWAVHAQATPLLTAMMLGLTNVGAVRTFLPALVVVGVWMWWLGERSRCAVLGGAMLGALVLNEALKLTFHRVRPVLPWSIHDERTYSFPSGHALFSVVLYGLLAYLAWKRGGTTLRRVMVVIPAVLLPLSIGFSRIYLGEHFPSDVLAGYVAGSVWLGGVVLAANRYRGAHSPAVRV